MRCVDANDETLTAVALDCPSKIAKYYKRFVGRDHQPVKKFNVEY